ncbi:MAG: hypothetical protein CL693_18250 [Cellvibrionaceae bacterium]|nr:hypothetical protein [Cellvibrionaceae bacterium]
MCQKCSRMCFSITENQTIDTNNQLNAFSTSPTHSAIEKSRRAFSAEPDDRSFELANNSSQAS